MHALLITLFLTGSGDAHGMKTQALAQPPEIHCNQPLTPVILVADGSSDWPGQAASRIAGELKVELDSCRRLEMARFDAGPVLETSFAVTGENRDLVMVKPRTPMREAMETGFLWLIDAPSPHTMVVIAHDQFYPTSLSPDRLLDLARRTETKVHTIHLESTPTRREVFRRLGRSLRQRLVWGVEVLGLGERGYSPADTARLLKVMADATGGKTCVATGERAGIDCARLVATEIVSSPGGAPSSHRAE
jgi:hypothetical protein